MPSREGLIMGLEASVLYHLDPRTRSGSLSAGRTELRRGPAGAELPLGDSRDDGGEHREHRSTRTRARRSRSRYSRTCSAQVQPRGIVIENVLLRDLQLPDTLKQAIEAKQQAQQEAQRMEFVLQREKQEAERKRVEAQASRTSRTSSARASATSCSSGRASRRRWSS